MPLTFDPQTVPLYYAERGAIRMTGTRIGLDTLIFWYKRDPRPEAILEAYPHLARPDVESLLAYYHRNQGCDRRVGHLFCTFGHQFVP